jgi:hypothetical protein
MLADAKVVQVMDWTLFQKTGKNAYFIDNQGNTTDTFVYVKFGEHIQKYTFDISGKLKNVNTETIECATA